MRKSTSSVSKLHGVLMMALALLATIFFAAGANYFMFHQNNTVPDSPQITVYHADGVTPYSSGSDLTGDWTWTGTQFTLTLVVQNIGNVVINLGLSTSNVPAYWIVSITGNGTLNLGANRTVTIVSAPPSLAGGTTSGDYDLWFTG